MQEQNEKEKKYRVARFYRNGKMSYDLFMNLTDKVKKISATKIREIAEGCTQSEFALVVEDETKGIEAQLWHGQKDRVNGVMNSKRIIDKNVDVDVGHLFVSECTVNSFAIKNNSEAVAQVADRLFEFVKQQGNKAQKPL